MRTFRFAHDCDHPDQVMHHAVDRIAAAYPGCSQEWVDNAQAVTLKLHKLGLTDEPVVIAMSFSLGIRHYAASSFSYLAFCEPIRHELAAQATLYGLLSQINNMARGCDARVEIPLICVAGKMIELANQSPEFVYFHPNGSCKYNSGGDRGNANDCASRGCIVGQAIRLCTPASHRDEANMLLSAIDDCPHNSAQNAVQIEEFHPWSNLRITANDSHIADAMAIAITKVQSQQDSGKPWQEAIKPLLQL